MRTRRDFVVGTAMAGLFASTSVLSKTPATPRIRRAERRDETILRLGGVGDSLYMTWAPDGKQYLSVCDGFGWYLRPKGLYNSHLWAIIGGPQEPRFTDVPGYPELVERVGDDRSTRYYGFGTLACDGRIYQFLSTPLHPGPQQAWRGAKLIYSSDNGLTWYNQNGSTPVVWEAAHDQSLENMAFFEEPQDAFSMLSFLQMGKGYDDNRDGYVYVYGTNGSIEGTMNELVMLRVARARVLDRASYEYYGGLTSNGTVKWVKDIHSRAVVHTFPRGWMHNGHCAWLPSVTYNAPLHLYMMANYGWDYGSEGDWSSKPSYFGIWVSSTPWGPWAQIHEETAWCPGDDRAARAYAPVIAPKWIAADGKSFWLVWSDYQTKPHETSPEEGSINEKLAKHEMKAADWTQLRALLRQHKPYYSFNAQRVDVFTV